MKARAVILAALVAGGLASSGCRSSAPGTALNLTPERWREVVTARGVDPGDVPMPMYVSPPIREAAEQVAGPGLSPAARRHDRLRSTSVLIQKAERVLGHVVSRSGVGPPPAAATDLLLAAVSALAAEVLLPLPELHEGLAFPACALAVQEAVTRAQMAVFLERGMRGSAYVPPPATGLIFQDVGAGDFD